VTAPTPFESQDLGKFQFYRCLEQKILLKIEIQIGGQAICILVYKIKYRKASYSPRQLAFSFYNLHQKKEKVNLKSFTNSR
jgi:hypothetical protein